MDKIFGVPLDSFMVVFLVMFAIGLLAMTVVALRDRVVFKMALRNLPRRPPQTVLIIVGLMLATLLFSASFSTGDTMTHSIRLQTLSGIGAVDEVVQGATRDASGRYPYFDAALAGRIRDALGAASGGDGRSGIVSGVVPFVHETAPVLGSSSGLSEPGVDVLGLAPEHAQLFGPLTDAAGKTLDPKALAPGSAYISVKAAEELDVAAGDDIQVYLGPGPTKLQVAGVFSEGAAESALVLPQSALQEIVGQPGRVNAVLVNNSGGDIDGAEHTDAVVAALKPVLANTALETAPVKQDALKQADSLGSSFSAIFLLFAQFSIAAGILLIFLIFVMLAAERKHELGMARALGAQRHHVVRLFALEGALYALIAGVVGSLLGVAVGWGMARIMSVAFGSSDLRLSFFFNWKSVVIAYTMGVVFTFVIVVISSWRVSRLNIVRAVRGLPDPKASRRGRRQLVLMIVVFVAAAFLTLSGFQGKQLGVTFMGFSLFIIALGLLARRLGAPDRAAFTGAGLLLLALWLLPGDTYGSVFDDMTAGIEMFFISGIMLVIAAVWVVIYNSDLLVAAIVVVLGRFRSLPPVLKTAVAYPMQNRFRTGMTLAMFSLIVFTLVCMAFIISAMAGIYSNTGGLSGGFDVRASTSYANPIADLDTAVTEAAKAAPKDPAVTPLRSIAAIGTVTGAFADVQQAGSANQPKRVFVEGVDRGYADNVTYDFMLTAPGYDTPRAVWQALLTEPGTAVVSASIVPSRINYSFNLGEIPFMMEGFAQQDETLPAVSLRVAKPASGTPKDLRVIGVMNSTAAYAGMVMTSGATLSEIFAPEPTIPVMQLLKLEKGADAVAVSQALEKRFLTNGMQSKDIVGEIRGNARATVMVNTLLQGFMALGLIVGIASLGVVAARAVVERRQQIGVLRAIGFQKRMVQNAFLIESSFVALVGIGMGVILGAALSPQIIRQMQEQFPGMPFTIPWKSLLVVILVAYAASLVTTYLPARQAAKVYPAEALRYE